MLVSVIIPSFNRRRDLCKCIDSVRVQTLVSIEMIVVDDCSEDDTKEFLTSHYTDVYLIACPRRYGPSHLRNLGLRVAKGEFILFLDSDVILPGKDIVHQMAVILSNNPNVGEIGGEIPVYKGVTDVARGLRRDFLGKNHEVLSKKNEKDRNPFRGCTYLATCNCMVRRDLAFQVGGFDPYYKFGGEDADFGYRILEAGYENRVGFSVGAYHYQSVSGRYPNETYRYQRTRIRFNMKHFSLSRNIAIFLTDVFSAVLFYLALLPKIVIKKLKDIRLVTENYLGGYYLIKSYLVNMTNYEKLKTLKEINFLSNDAMQEFETQMASLTKRKFF